MDIAVPGSGPTPPQQQRPSWGPGALVVVVEGVCAAVVGAFLATGSVQLALIVAATAVIVVSLLVLITCR